MGCGVDFRSDPGSNYVNVFFTKNGKQIGKPRKMKRPVHGLYPLIGEIMHLKLLVELFNYMYGVEGCVLVSENK